MTQDIRWVQRLDNYKKALKNIENAEQLLKTRPLSDLEKQGLVQAFEFTHELAWNMLKDYLGSKGFKDIHGSVDSTRLAFREGCIKNGEIWMEMIKSRNLSSHTYNEATANEIAAKITNLYLKEFQVLRDTMQKMAGGL
jgi:nucleotidyltransferase substrate binding protein (TIGR01987 family)